MWYYYLMLCTVGVCEITVSEPVFKTETACYIAAGRESNAFEESAGKVIYYEVKCDKDGPARNAENQY